MANSIRDVASIYMLILFPVSLSAFVMAFYFVLSVSTIKIFIVMIINNFLIFSQDVYNDLKYRLLCIILVMVSYLISECIIGQIPEDQVWIIYEMK